MSKFVYIEKLDELEWWIDSSWICIYVDSVPNKLDLRNWIEENCVDDIIVFGRTRWPAENEINYAVLLGGDGSVDIYCKNLNDAASIKLIWGGGAPRENRIYQ